MHCYAGTRPSTGQLSNHPQAGITTRKYRCSCGPLTTNSRVPRAANGAAPTTRPRLGGAGDAGPSRGGAAPNPSNSNQGSNYGANPSKSRGGATRQTRLCKMPGCPQPKGHIIMDCPFWKDEALKRAKLAQTHTATAAQADPDPGDFQEQYDNWQSKVNVCQLKQSYRSAYVTKAGGTLQERLEEHRRSVRQELLAMSNSESPGMAAEPAPQPVPPPLCAAPLPTSAHTVYQSLRPYYREGPGKENPAGEERVFQYLARQLFEAFHNEDIGSILSANLAMLPFLPDTTIAAVCSGVQDSIRNYHQQQANNLTNILTEDVPKVAHSLPPPPLQCLGWLPCHPRAPPQPHSDSMHCVMRTRTPASAQSHLQLCKRRAGQELITSTTQPAGTMAVRPDPPA
jgi:hypothetical protein